MFVAGCPSMMVCSLVDSVGGMFLGKRFKTSAFLLRGVLPGTAFGRIGALVGVAAGLCFVGDVLCAVAKLIEGYLLGVLAAEALVVGFLCAGCGLYIQF